MDALVGLPLWAVIAMGAIAVLLIFMITAYHRGKADTVWRSDSHSADLRPVMDQSVTGAWHLRIPNLGHGEARNVVVTVDGNPIDRHARFLERDLITGPIAAGASLDFLLVGADRKPLTLHVAWEDDSSDRRRWSGKLTIDTPA